MARSYRCVLVVLLKVADVLKLLLAQYSGRKILFSDLP